MADGEKILNLPQDIAQKLAELDLELSEGGFIYIYSVIYTYIPYIRSVD